MTEKMDESTTKINDLEEYAQELENALSSADEHIWQLENPAEPESPRDDTVQEVVAQESTVHSASGA